MVKTLERHRYALCEKHVIVPFCCSYQVYRYLAGCFGLISCRHYLKRVVRNQVADDVRKLQMRNGKLGAPIDMEEFAKQEARYRKNVDDAVQTGRAFEVNDLLKRGLDDAEYLLFSLLYLLEWPRERIARELNVSPAALKKRIFRLQKKIRRLWQDNPC